MNLFIFLKFISLVNSNRYKKIMVLENETDLFPHFQQQTIGCNPEIFINQCSFQFEFYSYKAYWILLETEVTITKASFKEVDWKNFGSGYFSSIIVCHRVAHKVLSAFFVWPKNTCLLGVSLAWENWENASIQGVFPQIISILCKRINVY